MSKLNAKKTLKKDYYLRNGILLYVMFALVVIFFIYQTASAFATINRQRLYNEHKTKIIIDAGHGGEDGGAVGITGLIEKDINLLIALELEQILTTMGFDVRLIRDGDYAVGDTSLGTIAKRKRSDMRKRLQIMQEAGDCIFVSIHQNFYQSKKYKGAHVYYSDNHPDSKILAEKIRLSIMTKMQPTNKRENKAANKDIFLLHRAQAPAVLVECGFLTNYEDSENLSDPIYQRGMAQAIADGICDYFLAMESSLESEAIME